MKEGFYGPLIFVKVMALDTSSHNVYNMLSLSSICDGGIYSPLVIALVYICKTTLLLFTAMHWVLIEARSEDLW